MRTKYIDLIQQTYDFPQKELILEKDRLLFHGIDLTSLAEQFGTPLKFTYLPKISKNIQNVQKWFSDAFKLHQYDKQYHYCYCTKSSHFKYVMDEVIKNKVHIETSSSFDLDIVNALVERNALDKSIYIICNGYKDDVYMNKIVNLINRGHNCMTILDNFDECHLLNAQVEKPYNIGIRIASEEEPKFEFYTSRLGIGYKDIVPFYNRVIKPNPKSKLKMLHFFINTGIFDNSYYWNELHKCLKVYIALKQECDTLDSLNIGGGFPIKNSLGFNYDYAYMINEIVGQVKQTCDAANVPLPHIFTEFGSYTVGESGGVIFRVINQKQQNDREKWNMIDSSFITVLPDTWAINKRFLMLPINRWLDTYERVLLGGLTCDSDDYYNSEQNANAIYLPTYSKDKPLYIGFLNTGAYQETIGGYGGLQHCLLPYPKHILISKSDQKEQAFDVKVFRNAQSKEEVLNILGY